MRVLLAVLLVLVAGCNGSNGEPSGDSGGDPVDVCPTEDAGASIDVSGTFRYEGDFPYLLRGTITFVQNGDVVTVTNTTYDNANDRALEGTATLQGNRLDIRLVPLNGDQDYEAQVMFLFSDDGSRFCVEFSDTNFDTGPYGSYRGVRQ